MRESNKTTQLIKQNSEYLKDKEYEKHFYKEMTWDNPNDPWSG